MGGSKGGDGEAKKARQAEEKRQADIRAGTTRINSIFDGGTVGSGAVAAGSAFDPAGTYYNADGTPWTPTAATPTPTGPARPSQQRPRNAGGRDGTASRGTTAPWRAAGQTPEEQFRAALADGKLFSGTTTSTGFDDDFFGGRRDAYTGYATPQLDDQRAKAEKELTFSLARGGNLDSSVRGEKLSELQKLYDVNKQKVADDALAYETQARTGVEDARANLISTLNATGDVQGATSAALARSQALSSPPAYSPLSQLFVDFTAGLGTQAALERAEAMGGSSYGGRYNTGLFGNAGRVINT